jgi:hypothetical protein
VSLASAENSYYKPRKAAQGERMSAKSTPRAAAADLKRRGFLLAGGVSAAGAVAAVVAPSISQKVPTALRPQAASDVGYQVSDHVRTYYDLARV